ncbi:Radical SAM domain protein [Methanocaldococcus infernus ME]|uniref:Radical SAM domain protein n=1 Tax=Methanocaldococcus infernus (strain DSM 11812 / JCM 15783 / ME) TaxID=573063 RepID=D5VQN4_METIM|nr:radical SAM protein [Methanocaldococcus infernus]ADG12887.1 Radical SAM domain protein [Methanocaldococcus infernus ME]
MILRSETAEKLERIVKRLKVVKHCIGCEGLNLEIENPEHHPSLELTQACNLNCPFCYSKLKKVRRGLYGDLDKAEALTISQYGEPLLDIEGVKKGIELGKSYGLRVDLQTNGVLLNEELLKEFKDLGLDIVMISLSSISKYKELYGKNFVDKVLENIRLASKYFHTIVRAIYLPGVNEKDLMEIAKLNVDEIMVHHLIIYNDKIIEKLKIDKNRLGSIKDLLFLVDEMNKISKANVTIKGCLLVQLKEMDGFILSNVKYDSFSEVPEIKRKYQPIDF